MIDWSFPPDIQTQYNRVTADIRRLQTELGIEARSLEQRAADYHRRKEEERIRQEELAKYSKMIGRSRPPLKFSNR